MRSVGLSLLSSDWLLAAESQGKVIELNGKRDGEAVGRKTAAAAPVALPAPETPSDANVGAVDSTVAQDPTPVVQKDPLTQWRESVGTAASWRSEPENHGGGGMFGPYPESLNDGKAVVGAGRRPQS